MLSGCEVPLVGMLIALRIPPIVLPLPEPLGFHFAPDAAIYNAFGPRKRLALYQATALVVL